MKSKLKFVEWSHGDMEGTKYDNVILSDGLLSMKVANRKGLDLSKFKESDEVNCTFALRGSKDLKPKLELLTIE